MQPYQRPTKDQERRLMRELKDKRERQSGHHSPAWLHAFWRRIAS